MPARLVTSCFVDTNIWLYAFIDMIVAAALQAGAAVLYSEDMQHGWQLEEQLRVLDPFRSS
jgi:predicted nucleic acid-binding protein